MRADADLVQRALTQSAGHGLQFANDRLRSDKAFVRSLASFGSAALAQATTADRSDLDVVLTFCKQDGTCVRHAMGEAKNSKDVELVAVRQAGKQAFLLL